MSFVEATRRQSFLKACIAGPSGAGKTFTALRGLFALKRRGLVKRIAVIESEAGKIHKYCGRVVDGVTWQFAVNVLATFAPAAYVAAINEAISIGYDGILIDSLSHEWQGPGGALEIVDSLSEKNKFAAWKTVTPQHTRFIDGILRAPAHVIATVRLKQGYVVQAEEKNGRTVQVPTRVGLQPIQRDGIEYEFELYVTMDRSHIATVEKTIFPDTNGSTFVCPGDDLFTPVIDWISGGEAIDPAAYTLATRDSAELNAMLERAIAVGLDMDGERAFIARQWGVDAFVDLTGEQFAKYLKRVENAEMVAAAQTAAQSAATSGETLHEALATTPTTSDTPIKGEPDAVPQWCVNIRPKFDEWANLKSLADAVRADVFAGLCQRFGNGPTLIALSINRAAEMEAFLDAAIARVHADRVIVIQ